MDYKGSAYCRCESEDLSYWVRSTNARTWALDMQTTAMSVSSAYLRIARYFYITYICYNCSTFMSKSDAHMTHGHQSRMAYWKARVIASPNLDEASSAGSPSKSAPKSARADIDPRHSRPPSNSSNTRERVYERMRCIDKNIITSIQPGANIYWKVLTLINTTQAFRHSVRFVDIHGFRHLSIHIAILHPCNANAKREKQLRLQQDCWSSRYT